VLDGFREREGGEMMHPIAVIDLVSIFAALTALIVLLKNRRRTFGKAIRLLLMGLLSFSMFYSVCLFFEWAGITGALEPLEDLIGALIPMWWAFVFYAFLQAMAGHDLKESEQRYRTILEDIEDGYYEVDLSGNLTRFNDSMCNIMGYPKGEPTGINFRHFTIDEDIGEVFEAFNRAYSTRKPEKIIDHGIVRKDGSRGHIELSISPVLDAEARPVGFRGIARDITLQKQMETQLQIAQRMEAIGTLAGGIAHDFNNLLMTIQGNVSLMLDDTSSGHQHHKYIRNIEKQIRSGSKLTAQLLGYARKGKYKVQALHLNGLIENTSKTFARTKKEITIHSELDSDLYGIEGDEGQIEQLLLNLYVNAADAMPDGGDLYLKTTNISHTEIKGGPYKPKPGTYVLLLIRDTGAGMDEETMKHIFEPFFTTKEMGRGTGLGLASVYGIVKGHGGYIDVTSVRGKETIFTIYLPATTRKVVISPKPPEQIVKGTETILIVDDEKQVLDVSLKMVEHLDYTALKAGSGLEAIEICEDNKDSIDLVILDMIMPGMEVGETYDRLKDIQPNLKVLLSSGYSLDGKATEILKRGGDGFIQKPYDIGGLSQKLREILDKSGNSK
jgi:two-component system cell cycle sensor histidine kinase/response regulator CckA